MLHTSIRHGKCFVVLLLAVVLPYHLSRAQSIKCIKTVPEQTTLDDHDFKWTDSYTFLLGKEGYMKDVTRWLKADNKMPRKRRSELNKKLGLTADFFGNHVRKDGDTLRCFFTNEEELKECWFLGHGQVVFKNDNWLVYGVREYKKSVLVFCIAPDGTLELNGQVQTKDGSIFFYRMNVDDNNVFSCASGYRPNEHVFEHQLHPRLYVHLDGEYYDTHAITDLTSYDFEWTDSFTFLSNREGFVKSVEEVLNKNNLHLSRKVRSMLKIEQGLVADLLENHVRKDGDTLRCFFTNEEELKECGLLGHGQVVFENNNWLVYEVKDRSGLNQTDAYVFSIAQDGLLELNGSVRIIAGRIKSSYGINMDSEGLFTICFQGDKPNNPVFVHRCVPAEEKQSLSRQGLEAM